MLIAVYEKKFTVSSIIIFGTLSFPVQTIPKHTRGADVRRAISRSRLGVDYVTAEERAGWTADMAGGIWWKLLGSVVMNG